MRHPYFDLPGPLILGHRGAAGEAPENTLVSFARGIELGAHIVETDVHLTRDGVPVLIHDANVERTTDGCGEVADLDLAELQRLDAGYRFSSDAGRSFPFRGLGTRIPSLAEALAALPDARFNIELKAQAPGLADSVLAVIRDGRRDRTTLVTAGEDEIMAPLRAAWAAAARRPALGASTADILEVVRSALAGEPPDTDSMALQIPAEFAGRPLATPELVRHSHAHGIQIHVWTINDPREIRRLLAIGVDGIVTDHPGRMAALLAGA
jgi:glycerophosphoryl diester phosphodiesterase